jgi:hypothetical protein
MHLARMLGRKRIVALAALFTVCRGAAAEHDGGVLLPALPDGVRPEAVRAPGARPRPDGAVQAAVADEELARWNVGGTSDPRFVSNRPGFHVAPRVMVDTLVRAGQLPARSSGKGVLSELAVLAQTRNHGYWPFRLCYEAGLRENPKLHGKSLLHVAIDTKGRVNASRVASTELADREVATCLAERAKELKFAPAPARRAGVDVGVELSPGDAPLPELTLAPSPGVDAPEPTLARNDTRRLEETLLAGVAGVSSCFAAGRTLDPQLWGRIGLRFDVDRHGNVTVREHESRFPDQGVVRCASAAVQALPLGGMVAGPISFAWGLRLGSPPPASPIAPIAPNQAKNDFSASSTQSAVAESPAPRVPLAR